MAYILIIRDTDGSLELLTGSEFETRSDALSALSILTGDTLFVAWDSEVLLVDLDSATPVLLVRPVVREPMSVIESGKRADEIARRAVGIDSALAEAGDVDTGDADAWLADIETTQVDDPAIAEAIAAEADRFEEAVPAAAAVPDLQTTEGALRAALLRSAEKMKSDGVAVPTVIEGPGMRALDEAEQGADVPVPSAPIPWPWDIPATGPATATTAIAGGATSDDGASSARLEEYGQAHKDAVDVSAPEHEADQDGDAFNASEVHAAAVSATTVEPRSDFILDLDERSFADPEESDPSVAPLTQAPAPAPLSLEEYTCDDCAYAQSCPNKDQRLPKDCGSFQWR